MESGEAESQSLSGLDGVGNPTPRPRDSSQDIPVWEQQRMTFPITFSLSKGHALPWTYFQAGAEAQQPKKAAVKCKLLPVPRCWAPGFPIKATTITGAAGAAEPLPGAGCATSHPSPPPCWGLGLAKGSTGPRQPQHSTPG